MVTQMEAIIADNALLIGGLGGACCLAWVVVETTLRLWGDE